MAKGSAKQSYAKRTAAWTPQPGPQLAAIEARWCDELLFGGARGGGKSQMLLGDWLQDVQEYGRHWQGILIRRTVPELQDVIRASQVIYPKTGAEWKEGAKEWRWPNGAVLRMRHLDTIADALHYQGHSFTWIGHDELGNWLSLEPYDLLRACLRWADAEVPAKRIRATANPGGPGHHAVKERFIDPAPGGYVPIDDPETGMARMFIPSRVTDNKILLKRDPDYIARLKGVGSAELVRAWLDGDWSAISGAYFDCWTSRLVIRPFAIPQHWTRFRAFDWGSASPFSVGWWTVCDGTDGVGGVIPHPVGALICYREWYGRGADGKGLKLSVDEVARGIIDREPASERITYSVADPSIWISDGGPSIAEGFLKHGIEWGPADNKRIAGWQRMRDLMIGEDAPMIYWFDTCADSIRTIPVLQHDRHRPEDVDTASEDHAADQTRYAVMSRARLADKPSKIYKPVSNALGGLTMDQLWAEQKTSFY